VAGSCRPCRPPEPASSDLACRLLAGQLDLPQPPDRDGAAESNLFTPAGAKTDAYRQPKCICTQGSNTPTNRILLINSTTGQRAGP
jgi:hypothetical protein